MGRFSTTFGLLFSVALAFGCDAEPIDTGSESDEVGDESGEGDGNGDGDEAFAGAWRMVEEDGVEPDGYGVDLNLTGDAFLSAFRSDGGDECSWSGGVTATETELTLSADSATGAPCSAVVGESRTARWSLDGDRLTLDFTDTPPGTLQVYERDS